MAFFVAKQCRKRETRLELFPDAIFRASRFTGTDHVTDAAINRRIELPFPGVSRAARSQNECRRADRSDQGFRLNAGSRSGNREAGLRRLCF